MNKILDGTVDEYILFYHKNDLMLKNKIDFRVLWVTFSLAGVELFYALIQGRPLKTSAKKINAKFFAKGDFNFIQAISW